jgi:hypothetical protein
MKSKQLEEIKNIMNRMFLDETTDTKTELSFKTKIQRKVNNFITKIKNILKKLFTPILDLRYLPIWFFTKRKEVCFKDYVLRKKCNVEELLKFIKRVDSIKF